MIKLTFNKFSQSLITLLVVICTAAFFFYIGTISGKEDTVHMKNHKKVMEDSELSQKHDTVWTCSMHPQIRQSKPGKCPLCAMDLISSGVGSKKLGIHKLELSDYSRKLAEVQVVEARKKDVSIDLRMFGKIDFDETRIKYISSWMPGRLDRLYVDYTGITVKKGDHLVYLYSPELITAQKELLEAIKAEKLLRKSGLASIRETSLQTIFATKEKLKLMGLTKFQIQNIVKKGKTTDHITIYSPISGIVIDKNATEGMYVKTGTRIYTIADLSYIWVKFEAYESDLYWLRYGQEVEFETEAYPGEKFNGRISFISPVLDEKTRTVKVRVVAENTSGKLKPGLFVRAVIHTGTTSDGQKLDLYLAGKWVCPMHPEIIKAKAGRCDKCGMRLLRTEKLGYVNKKNETESTELLIPATAPLITGKRAVVYVQVSEGIYEFRNITLGPRTGDFYIVKSGIIEGDLVVVNGNFKIDSAMQLLNKQSMMNQKVPQKNVPQTKCPVMGGDINKEVFIDFRGNRIYFCCPGCDAIFKKNPEKYLDLMKKSGVVLDKFSDVKQGK